MDIFKRLKAFYWPYKTYFFVSIGTLLLVTGVTVIYPLILKVTIDGVIGEGRVEWVPWIAAGFLLLMMLKAAAAFFHQYYGDLFGIRSVYELRNTLYQKLEVLPFRFYDNAKTGDLMSRLTADVEAFRSFLSFGCAQFLNFLLLVTFGLGIMVWLNPSLAMVTLLAMPFLAVTVYRFDRKVHPAFLGIRRSFAALTTKVQENISGMNTVKALAREDFEIGRFDGKNEDYKRTNVETGHIWGTYFPLMELVGNISVVALLAYGGWLVVEGELLLGELVAFFSLIWYIIGPLMFLGFTLNTYSQSKAAGERLLEVLDEPVEISSRPGAIQVDRLAGHVRFERVSHRYPGGGEYALKKVSFDAPPGKVIGLIGATGAGKSSLTQLISRFYEATEGDVLIDGEPVEAYDLCSLRKNIGVVFQESFLFSSTIKDNIAYGNPDVSMEAIRQAARRAQAHEFIERFPHGYNTMLGERGMGLSGGQKQRLAIARALVINPSILVLDDATSAVDMETEQKIQAAMREVMRGRTTFIIAHRISSVQEADEILVLEQGRVAERGTHAELLRSGGVYQRIYEIQFQDRKAVLSS
ncbi:MAG: ABC transporter ATP-binding protein [Firmicutes bacterium]|uniref:ATP-binding cassette, subfamily B n=1 Tax=Melghirimyces thermohalophilus TaxID=1236220 RepID=A0A1G6K364_9BACL|nr:ABC transporter ATP-binding protein [Melghirimyces thermohalophilus]MDA8353010.1 ABC transporter ATP-binding protein [Bacillota bacterium]SDC25469.1 ATP-binding cassette, subfamily B [Melghirimyces thermohalophilus]